MPQRSVAGDDWLTRDQLADVFKMLGSAAATCAGQLRISMHSAIKLWCVVKRPEHPCASCLVRSRRQKLQDDGAWLPGQRWNRLASKNRNHVDRAEG